MDTNPLAYHSRNDSIEKSYRRGAPRREYLYIYLPDLPVRQICIQKGWHMDRPVALYRRRQHTDRLVHLSNAARKAGLSAGMGVADARARVPDILLSESAPEQTRNTLEKLARWAWRYSPRTGIDTTGIDTTGTDNIGTDNIGIWIDVSGASHLHGGMDAIIADIKKRLEPSQIQVYCAAAPYFAGARALAQYHPQAADGLVMLSSRAHLMQMLSDLPLAALLLEDQMLQALSQAGLRRLHHLQPLSYAQLAIRFGPEFVQKWAVLSGNRDFAPAPIKAPPALCVSLSWPEPLAGADALQQMIEQLIQEIANLLLEAEMAASCFELGWQRSDGQIGRLYFNLSRPGRNSDILKRLLADAATRIEAEFGIDYSWLQAHKLAAELPRTGLLGVEPCHLQGQHIDHVLDILAAKLGADKVRRVTYNSSWQVSDSMAYQRLADAYDVPARDSNSWPAPAPASLTPPRPIRLFEPAEPVHVVALLPDHPPAMLRWRKKNWQIGRATGPERIGPRWWDAAHKGIKTRDYYRVETNSGMRLWVYREGLPERGEAVQWFVHGCFS